VGPTVTTPQAIVDWRITAIVARRLKGDHEVSAPLNVYDG
jgi:hypothetical protein